MSGLSESFINFEHIKMENNKYASAIEIHFNPTEIEMNEIKSWLYTEDKKTGNGFYCNWNIIEPAYKKGQVVIITYHRKAIGFLMWTATSHLTARIDIAEIKPSFRNKGIGKILIEGFSEFLVEKNIYLITLDCSPINSKPIWIKLRFIEYKNIGSNGEHYESYDLYKIIIPHLNKNNDDATSNIIKMWNCSPYDVASKSPFAVWNFEFEQYTNQLRLPIIYPAYDDWTLQISVTNAIIYEGKIKSFSDQIIFNDFLIIRNIQKLNVIKSGHQGGHF